MPSRASDWSSHPVSDEPEPSFEASPHLAIAGHRASVVKCGPRRGNHGVEQAAVFGVGLREQGAIRRELNQVVSHSVQSMPGPEESLKVGGDVRRPGRLRGERQVLEAMGSAQDEQRVHSRRVGACDVGVEAVPAREGAPGLGAEPGACQVE